MLCCHDYVKGLQGRAKWYTRTNLELINAAKTHQTKLNTGE